MASSWLDSWGASWGDAWGQQATDPNALRGTSAGSCSVDGTLSAVAWIAGSAAGTSTAQAYLYLDGAVPPAPTSGGKTRQKSKKPISIREAAPAYPWYSKDNQKSGHIPDESIDIEADSAAYDGVGTAAPDKQREESDTAHAVHLLQSINEASNSLLLTKKALTEITSASALKARQRQDDEAAMLALFVMMTDDD